MKERMGVAMHIWSREAKCTNRCNTLERENAKTTCQTGFTLSFAQTVKRFVCNFVDRIDLPGIGLQDCAIQKEWELTLGATKQLPLLQREPIWGIFPKCFI